MKNGRISKLMILMSYRVFWIMAGILIFISAEQKVFCQESESAHIDTIGTTWQISGGLSFANHQYTDVPVYNSNGSMALFHDKKGNFYINRTLTSLPEKISFKEEPKGKVEWDRNRPEILYYLSLDKSYSYIRRLNLKTGIDELIYRTKSNISEIAPAHPDGDHLLLAPKDQAGSIMEVYSLSTGKSIKIPMDVPLHRVRFTKSPDLTVYVNRSEKPKTSWLVNVRTGKKRQVYEGKSTSPSWRLGGENFCFYGTYQGNRSLLVLDTSGTVIKFFPELKNHHLGWSRDGRYIVTDVEQKIEGPYGGWICVVDVETGEIERVVRHESDFDTEGGEKNAVGHPHPQLSPDATKVVYNSTKLGMKHPQVFVSVVHLPDTVHNAKLDKSGKNVLLSWSESRGLETHQYLIFRILGDGRSELAAKLDKNAISFQEKFRDDVKEYQIVAREYSGLESKPVGLNCQ